MTLSGSPDVQLFLLPRCSAQSDPLAATMVQIDGGRLVVQAGTGSTRYLVVSGDSSPPAEACGGYRLETVTDPDSGRGTCANPLSIEPDGVENGGRLCDYPALPLDLEGLRLPRSGVVYRLDPSALHNRGWNSPIRACKASPWSLATVPPRRSPACAWTARIGRSTCPLWPPATTG